MTRLWFSTSIAMAFTTTLLLETASVHAQQAQLQPTPAPAAPVTPAAPVVVQQRAPTYEYETGPDPKLLRNGLWTLGVMYGASVVVTVVSPRQSDDYLLIPVAGPWLDLSHRDEDPGNDSKYETLNKALLIADGVAQAIGAANVVLSLIFPETRLVEQASRANAMALSLNATPIVTHRMIGLSAQGRF